MECGLVTEGLAKHARFEPTHQEMSLEEVCTDFSILALP
jgi:hypothetical protein